MEPLGLHHVAHKGSNSSATLCTYELWSPASSLLQIHTTPHPLYSGAHAEEQFVGHLMARKQKQLDEELAAVEPLLKRDFVIDIEMLGVEPRVWRRIRVAGGTKLNVLQDKVMAVPVECMSGPAQ